MVCVAGRTTIGGPRGLSPPGGRCGSGATGAAWTLAFRSGGWALAEGLRGEDLGRYRGPSALGHWIAAMPTMGRFSFKPPADP